MLVGDPNLRKLLFSGDQYVIPLFQRFYVWEKANWTRLWNDLTALAEQGAQHEHFLGSLVSVVWQHEPGEMPLYLVIDGQQRLTTIATLLCAIRDTARLRGMTKLAEEIQDCYLTHRHETGLKRYKIVLRIKDRQALFDLIDEKQPGTETRIGHAYRFFMNALREDDELLSNDGIQRIATALTARMRLVSITLNNENPFLIFETLNSTGQRLQESDLIRNAVFMRVPVFDQDEFDAEYWQPFEDSLDAEGAVPAIALTEFYRDFLMRDGTYVGKTGVYVAFKADRAVTGSDPKKLAKLLTEYAGYYRWIRRPWTIGDSGLRRELTRLSRIEVSTAYPLIFRLLALYGRERVSAREVAQCLQGLQSFVMRRSVMGESTRGYARLFTSAITALDERNLLASLVAFLDSKGWPADDVFIPKLVGFELYRRERDLTRLMLACLEEATKHKEPVDVFKLLAAGDLQIEHVMPQTVDEDLRGVAWQQMLGEEWETVHRQLLHTIGNLTLTGYNPELSNAPYPEKQGELSKSHLELNRYFATTNSWDAAAIEARGRILAERVAALWPAAAAYTLDIPAPHAAPVATVA